MPEIRKAVINDVPDLLGLVEQYWTFENIAGYNPVRVAALLERLISQAELGGGWIVHVSGVPAGYLLAVYVFSIEHFGLTAEIDELFVVPEYRARGIGANLLRTAEVTFVLAGCTNVSLQLSRGNEAAREFYRRHGYLERSGYELLDKNLVGVDPPNSKSASR